MSLRFLLNVQCFQAYSAYTCQRHDDRGGHGGGYRGGRGERQRRPPAELPATCIFTESFYTESGFLRREIFLEAAELAAGVFNQERMSQSSIRSLFNMLKAMDQRIKVETGLLEDEVREQYYKFVRQCVYQERRRVIPRIFSSFAERHTETATLNKREFHGFVEYLASIMARMKNK